MKTVTIYTDGGTALRADRSDVPIGSRLAPQPPRDDKQAPSDWECL